MSRYINSRYARIIFLITLLVISIFPSVVSAATLLSQSFTANSTTPTGSIVSLQKGTTDHVDAATTTNSNYIFGVVVDSDYSQLAISNNQTNQVHVATDGVEQVLVSDINGKIAV